MADISHAQAGVLPGKAGELAWARRLVLAACVALGAVAAFASISGAASIAAVEAAGPDLTRLLRGMAAIKALLGLGLLAGVSWRLAAPASALALAGYGTASFAIGAGLVLVWAMVSLALGAVLLHAGLIGGLVLLMRDPAVGQRLGQLLRAR